MAKFFKSVWFKCIFSLLAIALVSGGILSVLNNVLYVSPAERTARAMKKVYGTEITVQTENIVLDTDSTDATVNKTAIVNEYGSINKIYIIGDALTDKYDKVFQATGYEGYKGGTITLWVKIVYENGNAKNIDTVVLETFDKQTLMSKLGDAFYKKFTYAEFVDEYTSGKIFTSDSKNTEGIKNVVTGASKSANAGCNAVNCIIAYVWGN